MYIVLEGIDTSGKSTQIELLSNKFKNAIFTKEPSASAFGKQIRELSLYGNLDNTTQALLFMSDRANHTKEIILPNKDKLIISDRSFISGVAYCSSLDFDLFLRLNLSIAQKPNLVVILETNKEILQNRLSAKILDDIENIGIMNLLEIQKKIFNIVKILEIDYIAIPCDKDKDEICEIISSKIQELN